MSSQDELNIWYWLGVWDPIIKLLQIILLDPWLKPAFLAHLRGIGALQERSKRRKREKREKNKRNKDKNNYTNNTNNNNNNNPLLTDPTQNIQAQMQAQMQRQRQNSPNIGSNPGSTQNSVGALNQLNQLNQDINSGSSMLLSPLPSQAQTISESQVIPMIGGKNRMMSPDPLSLMKQVDENDVQKKLLHTHRRTSTQSLTNSEVNKREKRHLRYYSFILWFVRHAALSYIVNGGNLDLSIKSLYYRFAGWFTTWWFDVLFPINIKKFSVECWQLLHML